MVSNCVLAVLIGLVSGIDQALIRSEVSADRGSTSFRRFWPFTSWRDNQNDDEMDAEPVVPKATSGRDNQNDDAMDAEPVVPKAPSGRDNQNDDAMDAEPVVPKASCAELGKLGEYDETCYARGDGTYRTDFCGCKLPNGPATTCAPTAHVLGEVKTTCSKKGTIPSYDDCEAAIEALDLVSQMGRPSAEPDRDFPSGCYIYESWDGKRAIYNDNNAGQAQKNSYPVCREGTIPTFEPHCFDDEEAYRTSYCADRLMGLRRDDHCDVIPGWTDKFEMAIRCNAAALAGEYDEACFETSEPYRENYCACKMATGPLTKCSPTGFGFAKKGTNCPHGPLTLEECTAATEALVLDAPKRSQDEYSPTGCFRGRTTGGKIYFNQPVSDSRRFKQDVLMVGAEPLCRQGTVLAFEEHCFGDGAETSTHSPKYKKAWSAHCAEAGARGVHEPSCVVVAAYNDAYASFEKRSSGKCAMPPPDATSFFKYRHRSTYCEGKDDPITLDAIPEGKGLCVDGHCFDVDALMKWVKVSPRHPLTRRSLLPEELKEFS